MTASDGGARRRELGQYFTPRWAAEAIVERYFSDLPAGAVVIEPSCGDGSMLLALPDAVHAIGVEIDPVHAQTARMRSGRQVITGDFLTVDLPAEASAVVGNPPFQADTVAAFLERAHQLLHAGGRCGFILPAYILQTSSKVMSFAKQWSIATELMPRNLFPGLSLPITFTTFTKDQRRTLVGLFLYREAQDVAQLPRPERDALSDCNARGSVWRRAVHRAFDKVGQGSAALSQLYAALGDCPAENRFPHQQVRKVLQTYPEFVPVARGVWRRAEAVC